MCKVKNYFSGLYIKKLSHHQKLTQINKSTKSLIILHSRTLKYQTSVARTKTKNREKIKKKQGKSTFFHLRTYFCIHQSLQCQVSKYPEGRLRHRLFNQEGLSSLMPFCQPFFIKKKKGKQVIIHSSSPCRCLELELTNHIVGNPYHHLPDDEIVHGYLEIQGIQLLGIGHRLKLKSPPFNGTNRVTLRELVTVTTM